MRLPTIRGIIDRRILVNYRVDPTIAARVVPAPFRPKITNGYAIAGICLIRLKQIRPEIIPIGLGLSSENAAHRIAVEWDHNGSSHEGVYIPRRDTDSQMTTWLGGRLFPGEHHHANFVVQESNQHLQVAFQSDDRRASVSVDAQTCDTWPAGSIFNSLNDASEFFQRGSIGYSASQEVGRFDGLELQCEKWETTPLHVRAVSSSFFENTAEFPEGSVQFDSALLMKNIDHHWHAMGEIRS